MTPPRSLSTAIDLHHHFMPDALLARLRERAAGAKRLIADDISVGLDPRLADAEAHLGAMDHAGVATALLSHPGLSFMGADVCRDLNDGAAAWARAHPGRFVGAAHVVPAEGAAHELERCAKEHGFRVLAVPTSSGDVQVDDAPMDAIWETAERLGLLVLFHPTLRPAGAPTRYGLERSIARPLETAYAATRVMRGVTDRFPSLRFVLPHCGGAVPALVGRMAMFYDHESVSRPEALRGVGLTRTQQKDLGLDRLFHERFRRFYADTAGHAGWPETVKLAADTFGADRLVFGSDFPFEAKSGEELAELLGAVRAAGLGATALAAVERTTAAALLGL